MDEHLLIGRIRRLCARLVEIAPWWAGFWVPVEEARLSEFETIHGIELPSGYRHLLAEIGDRAPIPGRPRGGVIELQQALDTVAVRDWLGSLAAPFSGGGDDAIELEWDDAVDAYRDPTPLSGCLPVVDAGDSTYLLVVTGHDRGRVWRFSASGSPQLRPVGARFLAWYLGELERGLAPLEAEANERAGLEQRIARDPTDLSATVALGRRLLLIDRARARALLERAWAKRTALDEGTGVDLRRGIAELDLLDQRFDRIEAMANIDDDWLQTYAGIAASLAGDRERAIERLERAKIPVLLRSAAIGHLAAAHAAEGRIEHGLALLRATQASASNHVLAAQLRTQLGQHEAARRSWQAARASGERTGPRRPRLADFIELGVPDPATIDAAIGELERGGS